MERIKKINIKYRPEIDALRALAVLAIICYHAPPVYIFDINFFKGGYVGVDIFFVISGYLITSIIHKEISQKKSFSLINFYERRIRRIIPALLFLICICSLFVFIFFLPTNLIDFSKSAIFSLFFSSNYYFYLSEFDYSTLVHLKKPLLHTWSLAVEEQFYLFYPLIFIFIYRYFKKFFLYSLFFLFFLSFTISQISSELFPVANFYFLHTRIWELLAGSIICCLEYNKVKRNINNFYRSTLVVIGFSLMIGSVIFFDDKTKHPSAITLIPVLGASLFIYFSNSKEIITKIFSNKITVGIGLISYSLYLWHYPFFAFLNSFQFTYGFIFKKDIFNALIIILILLSLSILSFYFIEKPFRKKEFKFKKVLFFILSLFLVVIFLNLYFIAKDGKVNKNNVFLEDLLSSPLYESNCKFSNSEKNFNIDKKFLLKFNECKKKYKDFTVIIGDSHSRNLFNSFSILSGDQFIIGLNRDGCRPSDIEDNCHYKNSLIFLDDNKKNIKAIIFNIKGAYFLTNHASIKNPNFTSVRRLPLNNKEIDSAILFAEKLNKIASTYFVGPHIEPNIELDKRNIYNILENKNLKSYSVYLNLDLIEVDKFLSKEFNLKKITYISKIDSIKFDLERDFLVNGKFTFSDHGHWSHFGEKYFGKKLIDNTPLKNFFK